MEPVEHEVVVVGAGFGGIAAAIRLREHGHDVLVIEKADAVGGTWRDNTYPGAGCDVPSALYSFSFAHNPDWSRRYAGQAEILDYLQRTTAEHAVARHVRFGTALQRADWDERSCRWLLRTSTGPVVARWLVAASGTLHEPAVPALPGLDGFAGTVFHSSRWDHEHDLRGRRVAVLGTGASALQLVPRIAPQVDRLVLLQRSAPWVLPKPDRTIPRAVRGVFRRVPILQRAVRLATYLGTEYLALGSRRPWVRRPLARVALRHLRRQVRDPGLRARLHPAGEIGCSRILQSNDWYPALTRTNIVVAAGDVREVRARSIVDGDGREHPVDTLILATGFRAAEPPIARRLHDAHGVSMAERFGTSGARAHLGTTVAGFPNLFLLGGPNSLVYASSIVVLEAQVEHLSRVLDAARRRRVDRIEVRACAEADYNAELHRRLDGTVWGATCHTWYVDGRGRNTTMWPGTTTEFRRRLRRVDPTSFRFGRDDAAA